MTELFAGTPEAKECPICSLLLPLSEFGVCRARKDGRNLYCKSCIRRKVTESRRAQKAYKSVREQYAVTKVPEPRKTISETDTSSREYVTRQISKMTPVERVREAIRNGARTQKEIAMGTKLGKDEIGDALANLLLWTREIRTEVLQNTRMYFINDPDEETLVEQQQSPAPKMPRRKRDVPSSFSSLQVLMPGSKPEGETVKPAGWVAA
jgi:hypothetical protein